MSLLLLLVSLLGLVSDARAQEYRKITLSSGRAVVGIVESTLADGMLVRVPQGVVKVPFVEVVNLEPVDSAVYASQRSWAVVVLPFAQEAGVVSADVEALRARLADLTALLPAVQPALAESRPVPPGRGSVEVCGRDAACAARMGGLLGADVVLSGVVASGDGGALALTLVGTFTATPGATASATAAVRPPFSGDRGALFTAIQTALSLSPDSSALPAEPVASAPPEPPAPPPGPVKPPPPEPRPMDAARLSKLVWVPVPGLPAMLSGDGKRAALAWGITLPVSATLVNVAGHAAFTRPQLLATSVLGTAMTAIAVNHAVGLRHDLSAAVAPAPGGGAMLQVALTPSAD